MRTAASSSQLARTTDLKLFWKISIRLKRKSRKNAEYIGHLDRFLAGRIGTALEDDIADLLSDQSVQKYHRKY